MLPSRFEYHRPESLEEAFQLLSQYGDDAKVLAGGQSLIPVMKLRLATPGHIVDISRLTLDQIAESGDTLTVGALARHRDVERSDVIKSGYPLMATAAPLISDPGYKLVRAAREAGYQITALPGASAVLTALTVSGLPTDRFFFEGFLPPKQAARQKRIAALANTQATLVLFEGGSRLASTLADLAATFGPRAAAICRELTKLHEEVRYENLDVLARLYAKGAETRGEFVVLVAPPAGEQRADDIDALLKRALLRVSVKDAVGEVAVATGRPRREVYQRALALTKDDENGRR